MSSDEIEPVETRSTSDPGAVVYLVLMALIGSTTATAAKYAVKDFPLGSLPLARFGIAALCLLPFVWKSGCLARMVRHDFGRLVVTAAFCIPINQAFFLAGTRMAPTSHVGVIYATCPLVVLLVASALGQERLVLRRLLGVVLSVAGVVIIGLGNVLKSGGVDFLTLRGDLLLVGAVISWGAYLTVNKPLVAKYGSMPVLAGTFLVGSLIQLPIAAWTFGGIETLQGLSPTSWRSVAYLAFVVTICGLFAQNQALRRLDASQVATVGNVAPFLTIVWGIVLHGEELSTSLVIGAGLTLSGIVWASRPVRPSIVGPGLVATPALEVA